MAFAFLRINNDTHVEIVPRPIGTLPPVAAEPATTRYLRDSILLGLAVGIFAVGFGVLATTSGLTVAQTCAMSVLVFTGASQFAAVGVIGAGGDPATAIGSALLLGARNSFYGMTMSSRIHGSALKRAVGAQLTIDESTAMAVGQTDPEDVEPAFWASGISVFVFWNIGTLVGALGGNAIPDPLDLGLDAAFPAGFVALMMPALRQRPGLVSALSGAAIAVVSIPFTRPGVPILLAGVGAVVAYRLAGPPPATSSEGGPQ